MAVHTTYFQRPNGDFDDIEIKIEFTLTGGSEASGYYGPPEHYDPGSAPEFEIVSVEIVATGETTELTSDEYGKVEADVMDRLGDFPDDLGDEYL